MNKPLKDLTLEEISKNYPEGWMTITCEDGTVIRDKVTLRAYLDAMIEYHERHGYD